MVSTEISDSIKEVLQEMVNANEIFTAFDVTKRVRQAVGPADRIEHRDVRSIVHQEHVIGTILDNYTRTEGVELTVDGNPLVIVYHPPHLSGYDHSLALQPSPAGAVDPDDTDSDDDDDTDAVDSDTDKKGGYTANSDGSFTINVTSEKRFTFPKCLLGKVDVASIGGSYDFKVGADTINRRPNRDGRVRIGQIRLGLGDSIKVTVDTDTKTFTIETA